MQIHEIPILLLTGYLGSGKTTLVNRILTNQQGLHFAVIVNDIGEINIDASLIQKGGVVTQQNDSLVALQNGCICCTLQMDLVKQLQDIVCMQKFDYIVVEASGICEPAPIAQTICSIPQMTRQLMQDQMPVLDCIATVVDALRLKDEFRSGHSLMNPCLKEDDLENLVIQQIEFCNVIILNKISEVETFELHRIKEIIRAIQPKAEIFECDFCDIQLDKIIGTGMFNFDDVAGSAAWIQAVEGRTECADNNEHNHHHEDDDHGVHDHHHHHHEHGETEEYGISTFVYEERRPMNLARFDDFVARKWPKSVIRAKGMCYFSDEPDVCYVFEQAGRQVSLRNAGQWYATMPKEDLMLLLSREPQLQKDWDEQYGDRMQRIVFIGQKLDKNTIKHVLDDCLD